MSVCSARQKKLVVVVGLWRALTFLLGVVRLLQAVPLLDNDSSSLSHIVTEMDMVSSSAMMRLDSVLPLDGNHTLMLEPNSTLPQVHDPTVLSHSKRVCKCWNSTDEFLEEVHCRCEGSSIMRVPQKLTTMHKLTLEKVGIKRLRENALSVYANELQDLFFISLKDFHHIEARAFAKLRNLRTLYIAHAPKLQFLESNVFEGISTKLKTLRIIHCGLLAVPDMRMLSVHIILHMVDLDGNQIQEIHERAIQIKTDELILDNNALTDIHGAAFFGSQVAKLSLKLNFKLKHIHPSAFVGMRNIRELDLSGTALEAMPTEGLSELEVLRIQNTHSLKTIPSVYNFKNLQTAYLTHSFHCCAFQYPARHDPDGHEQALRRFHEVQKKCIAKGYSTPNVKVGSFAELATDGTKSMSDQTAELVSDGWHREKRYAHPPTPVDEGNGRLRIFSRNSINFRPDEQQDGPAAAGSGADPDASLAKSELGESYFQPITGLPMGSILQEDVSDLYTEDSLMGFFHETEVEPSSMEAICGNLTPTTFDVKCYPMPDALNPCEDVMGSHWLRGSVWVVVLLAVFGNVAVLVVLFSNRTDLTVPKFLICHLAFADLCMGLYLLLIASIDAHSMGEYFNFAFDWQYGFGCKVAGFLTVFASHLSIFTLTIVTLERWFAITHAIYLNKRIKLSAATYIMIAGWIYSAVMAAFPLFGISNYSSTSICLPMEARDTWDIAYLLTVLGINGLAFIIIVICYAQIYFSLGKETRQAARSTHSGEMTVAKKMALLVFTNFACWAPIAFFGLTAIAGYPLIDVTKSKILLVFFYPLNSCANPYLYAILTMQYRKDFFTLLSNYGLCTQRAQQYKMTYSLPTNTIQIVPARGSITTTLNTTSNTNGTTFSQVASSCTNMDQSRANSLNGHVTNDTVVEEVNVKPDRINSLASSVVEEQESETFL
ncbi:follicle-stimulating hormone receptor [Aedes aegypti]|uniref:G-protein coupled receptors family 1 profile domain-containing protein n=1 Tax=Aedes aegypti TaxID=7159 RepID=A0A6I8T731_AEDAE|nr:follicle-stimulating hormone receptor [Aedes aegypti]